MITGPFQDGQYNSLELTITPNFAVYPILKRTLAVLDPADWATALLIIVTPLFI
jgi:hypothetical protein